MICLNVDKIQLICKLYSPDGSSAGCNECPLGEYCGDSFVTLDKEEWREVVSAIDSFKIPSYQDMLRANFKDSIIDVENIIHVIFPYEFFKGDAVPNNAGWNDSINLEFLNSIYPEK